MKYFHEEEIEIVQKQRKTLLWIFGVVLALYVLISAGLITWYILLPYASPTHSTVKLIHYPLTIIVIIFLFVFMGIPYKRINRIYKFCKQLKDGKTECSEGSFFEYDEDLQEKDGVDCKALIFIEWNKYKKDFFERKVLVFYEKPFPEIPEGAQVEYVTQGNFLLEYEIISVPEQEEIDEPQTAETSYSNNEPTDVNGQVEENAQEYENESAEVTEETESESNKLNNLQQGE